MTGLIATPAASRAAAVALLLALLGLAAAMILVPLWLIDRQHEELAAIDQRLRTLHAGLANQAQQAEGEAVPDVQGTIEAQSPSLAGGIIQELTGNAVVVSGGELRSAELLPTRDQERFVAVPIRVTFTGDSVMLREFLYRIETSSPVLAVERLDVTAEQNPEDPSNVWQGDIQVAAEIVGWMRQPEPQS